MDHELSTLDRHPVDRIEVDSLVAAGDRHRIRGGIQGTFFGKRLRAGRGSRQAGSGAQQGHACEHHPFILRMAVRPRQP